MDYYAFGRIIYATLESLLRSTKQQETKNISLKRAECPELETL